MNMATEMNKRRVPALLVVFASAAILLCLWSSILRHASLQDGNEIHDEAEATAAAIGLLRKAELITTNEQPPDVREILGTRFKGLKAWVVAFQPLAESVNVRNRDLVVLAREDGWLICDINLPYSRQRMEISLFRGKLSKETYRARE